MASTKTAEGRTGPAKRVALVAHDQKKPVLVEWVRRNLDALRPHRFWATGTTGGVIAEACPELDITRLLSGPLGDDAQLGAMIAEGRLDLLVFFIDPLAAQPHDVDVKALTRLAIVYDLPMACGLATADLVLASPPFARAEVGTWRPRGTSRSGRSPSPYRST